MNDLEVLSRGEVEVLGRLPYSTNYAFLVRSSLQEESFLAVYKPRRGERPLWDFPAGTLAAREVAAYLVAEAAGWNIVPPTVMREDAPLGPGSLQVFIEHDPERHYFVLLRERPTDLATFAAFDVAINNADRKGGHVVEASDGSLYGLDHGLCFNVEPKLRTVIWAFAGQGIPAPVVRGLERLELALAPGSELQAGLGELLAPEEIAETRGRLRAFLASGVYPQPEGPFSMPWPLI